ncbi:MAG: hypothetical protein M3Y05_06315 [Gemmatimonadota bacterium]|nr:hypothetical protein [Gemmatimonadota bacterium]
MAGLLLRLNLVATHRDPMLPERLRYCQPLSDSAQIDVIVDSSATHRVYGRLDGDTRHFCIPWGGIGEIYFVATHAGKRWRFLLNSRATDSGLLLEGAETAAGLKGTWKTRYPSDARGTFVLSPGLISLSR